MMFTLDKMAAFTQSEDHSMRFRALGWNTDTIDGHDLSAIDNAIAKAKANKNDKPTIIIAKTIIGKGIEEIQGTNAAHGEAGVPFQKAARKNLGLPEDELWHVSAETKSFFRQRKAQCHAQYDAWQKNYAAWKAANPALASELEAAQAKKYPTANEVLSAIPAYDAAKNVATRQSGSDVLQHVAKLIPQYVFWIS